MKVLLANPRGFCAGVDRAIDIVERAIELFGAPIYVRHEVVHNRFVVERLRGMGAVFVDELDAVPDGATVIFSAHGVSSAVEEEAARRGLSARGHAVSTAPCRAAEKFFTFRCSRRQKNSSEVLRELRSRLAPLMAKWWKIHPASARQSTMTGPLCPSTRSENEA